MAPDKLFVLTILLIFGVSSVFIYELHMSVRATNVKMRDNALKIGILNWTMVPLQHSYGNRQWDGTLNLWQPKPEPGSSWPSGPRKISLLQHFNDTFKECIIEQTNQYLFGGCTRVAFMACCLNDCQMINPVVKCERECNGSGGKVQNMDALIRYNWKTERFYDPLTD